MVQRHAGIVGKLPMIRPPQKICIPLLDPFKDFGVEVPRPKKFPVSFDEMLRCLCHK